MMSMSAWARAALPYTVKVTPITITLSRDAGGQNPSAIASTASRLIELLDEISREVPTPPDPEAAALWNEWLRYMRLSGEEFIRGATITHKLQPAADYAKIGNEQLNALIAIIEAMGA